MSATATATAIEPQVGEAEQHLVIDGIEWDQYVTINDALLEQRGLRLIYIDGSLTFLTLSRRHGWFVDYLDSILKAVALGCAIDLEIAGSATLRVEKKRAGVEGDRTYYFGANATFMSGPLDIDLTTQPPPDLAIEVEVSHPAHKAILTYARIGVAEVWRYDARKGTLAFLILGPDGEYRPSARSRNLPMLAPEDVLGLVQLAREIGPFSRWHAQLNEWVRLTILPRMVEG